MNKTAPKDITTFRKQIDVIDDQIIALLKERTNIVHQVGALKRETAPKLCPIRPGREATMLRDIAASFAGSDFSPAAACNVWRQIIGASTAIEADLKISVFAPDKEQDLFWIARDYFSTAASYIKQPHINRVIGDVIDGKASVGIVPNLEQADTSYWWTNLLQSGADAPKIFACLPYALSDIGERDKPTALAFARLMPESSGDDVSLYVLETNHNTSQNRLQTAFAKEGLEAHWVNVATLSSHSRHHLIELNGFVAPSSVDIKHITANLGDALLATHFLGAYAKPFYIAK